MSWPVTFSLTWQAKPLHERKIDTPSVVNKTRCGMAY
jgi:hypothetical protein